MGSSAKRSIPRPPWRLALAAAIVVTVAFVVGVGSAAPEATTATPPSNTSPPSVTGTAQQGQALLAVTGSWSGDAPITFGFRWQRCDVGGSCSDIAGAAASSYSPVAGDVGRRLRVVVTASNVSGTSTATSGLTAAVAPPGSAPAPQAQPDPSGNAVVGQAVTVGDGAWSGTAPFTFSYQWQRCSVPGGSCVDIPGATARTYLVQASDAGSRLRAIVRASNAIGSSSATSNLTAIVASPSGAPVATVPPSIAGRVEVGQALSGVPGSWLGAQPISFAFGWSRCDSSAANCQTIPGAAATVYRVAPTDAGARLQFVVRASNASGSATAASSPTVAVARGALPDGAMQLPDGKISIPASSVTAPERLVVSSVSFTPNPIRARTTITARFRVTDTRGHVVRDALVYAIGLPYGWFAGGKEVPTGTDGYAVVAIAPTAQLPVGRRGAAVFFVRARKAGDSLLTGVSIRRLVQVRLA